MPYTIPGDAIVEVQIVGRLHDQTIRNVFHYHKIGPAVADGAAELTDFIDLFQGAVCGPYLASASEEYHLRYIQAQWIRPMRYRAVVKNVDSTGATGSSSLPSSMAAVISTYASLSGPEYQGRKYFAGVPVTFEVDSKLSGPGMAWLDNIATGMVSILDTTGASYEPIITDEALGLATDDFKLEQAVPRDVLRVQRRREVGQGE